MIRNNYESFRNKQRTISVLRVIIGVILSYDLITGELISLKLMIASIINKIIVRISSVSIIPHHSSGNKRRYQCYISKIT